MKKFFSPLPISSVYGIGLVRIITGLLLVYHGWEVFDANLMKGYAGWETFKTYPSPAFMVYLGKTAELVGGILLTIGLFTRVAVVLTAGTMLFISLFVGHGKIWYEDQHPFLFVLLAMVFFFTGPGAWSVDETLFKNK